MPFEKIPGTITNTPPINANYFYSTLMPTRHHQSLYHNTKYTTSHDHHLPLTTTHHPLTISTNNN
jgi:hypothetical protein